MGTPSPLTCCRLQGIHPRGRPPAPGCSTSRRGIPRRTGRPTCREQELRGPATDWGGRRAAGQAVPVADSSQCPLCGLGHAAATDAHVQTQGWWCELLGLLWAGLGSAGLRGWGLHTQPGIVRHRELRAPRATAATHLPRSRPRSSPAGTDTAL